MDHSYAPEAGPKYAADGAVVEWIELDDLLRRVETLGGMVVGSERMRPVVNGINRLGPYKATVLIHGESGTGKELVARALHLLGPAPKGPFVSFNCSNLLESLAESQLFGHIRGAFTDAREDSLGYFRSANGGTLFLDEIGELPLRLQPKLLRAVELHEVQPVGSSQSYKVDFRLVAATNRDLQAMVEAGTFRDDLYYRLSATAITIPPLRERLDGLEALAAYLLSQHTRTLNKSIRRISRRALEALKRHDWPGNVRELSHALQAAVMLTEGDGIDINTLPEAVLRSVYDGARRSDETIASEPATPAASAAAAPTPATIPAEHDGTPLKLDEVIRRTLIRSLEETEGNRRRAASLLGVSRSTLYRMLVRYSLAEEETGRGVRPQ
ncbi:MAG TPA: sigma-54 dependent transcriptional regulator [Candidatus Binataceae bacterium]|nr:sigma-54 dependent transcriptional regulator [Candidatus Binataceae bacterium]